MSASFSFEKATAQIAALNEAIKPYTDENKEVEGSSDQQAHFALMKAYALISISKCLLFIQTTTFTQFLYSVLVLVKLDGKDFSRSVLGPSEMDLQRGFAHFQNAVKDKGVEFGVYPSFLCFNRLVSSNSKSLAICSGKRRRK